MEVIIDAEEATLDDVRPLMRLQHAAAARAGCVWESKAALPVLDLRLDCVTAIDAIERLRKAILWLAPYFVDPAPERYRYRHFSNFPECFSAAQIAASDHPLMRLPQAGSSFDEESVALYRGFLKDAAYWLGKFRYRDASKVSFFRRTVSGGGYTDKQHYRRRRWDYATQQWIETWLWDYDAHTPNGEYLATDVDWKTLYAMPPKNVEDLLPRGLNATFPMCSTWIESDEWHWTTADWDAETKTYSHNLSSETWITQFSYRCHSGLVVNNPSSFPCKLLLYGCWGENGFPTHERDDRLVSFRGSPSQTSLADMEERHHHWTEYHGGVECPVRLYDGRGPSREIDGTETTFGVSENGAESAVIKSEDGRSTAYNYTNTNYREDIYRIYDAYGTGLVCGEPSAEAEIPAHGRHAWGGLDSVPPLPDDHDATARFRKGSFVPVGEQLECELTQSLRVCPILDFAESLDALDEKDTN